jgi:hypothetical protein
MEGGAAIDYVRESHQFERSGKGGDAREGGRELDGVDRSEHEIPRWEFNYGYRKENQQSELERSRACRGARL